MPRAPILLFCRLDQKGREMQNYSRADRIAARGIVLVGAAFLLFGAGCSHPATGPDASQAPGIGRCRDSGCPAGEECGGAGCVPVKPTLYSHIQLGSVLFRAYKDDAEIAWRAQHADLLIGKTGVYADKLRSANPNVRLFEYALFRYYTRDEDDESWAASNGISTEDFYLHYREDVHVPGFESVVLVPGFPPGVVPGWNPKAGPDDPQASAADRSQSRAFGTADFAHAPWNLANITNAGYRRFLIDKMARLMDGSLYNAPIASGPVEGLMVDCGIYYPQYREGVIEKTDEFYQLPLDDSHPYALGFLMFHAELRDALENRLSSAVDIMPNFSDAFFLLSPDPLSQGALDLVDWAWAEVWVLYRGISSPTRGSYRAITYEGDYETAVANIVRQSRAGGRRVLGAQDRALPSAGSERGRLFTLALYYLVHNSNTFYVYSSANTHDRMSQWQWNPAVTYDIGRPAQVASGHVDFEGRTGTTEHYEFASGPDPYDPSLTYHVLARNFTNGMVLVKMLPSGSVVGDASITTHTLDRPYRILGADGTPGSEIVTQVSIRNNEGIILVLP
jgi:hypothetical protein